MTEQASKAPSVQSGVKEAVDRVTARADARQMGAKKEAWDLVPTGQRVTYIADVLSSAEVVVPYDDLRTLLTALSAQEAMAKGLETVRNAGLILLKIVDETDEYQKRPESGDWGVECACCMGELFQCDRADIDTARTALSHYRSLNGDA